MQKTGKLRGISALVGLVFAMSFLGLFTPQASAASVSVQKYVRNVSASQNSFSSSVSANRGDQLEFMIVLTATSGSVGNIHLIDSLPAGLEYINNSLRIDGAAASNNPASVYVGSINSGASKQVSFRVHVTDAAFAMGSSTAVLTNNVYMSSDSGTGSSSVQITATRPMQSTTISVESKVRNITTNSLFATSTNAKPGDNLEHSITIRNNSSVVVNNLRLSQSLPSALTYAGILSINGQYNGNVLTEMYLGQLTSNESRTISFRTNVNSSVAANTTVASNTTAVGDNAASATASAFVNIVSNIESANLALSLNAFNVSQGRDAVSSSARAGDIIDVTLRVRNNSSTTVFNYMPEISLANTTHVADLIQNAGGMVEPGRIRFSAINIAPGNVYEKIFTIKVKNPIPQGAIRNISLTHGNSINISISGQVAGAQTPPPYVAPNTGAGTTASLGLGLILTLGIALVRNRQLFGIAHK